MRVWPGTAVASGKASDPAMQSVTCECGAERRGLKNRGPKGHFIPLAPKCCSLEALESKGDPCNIQTLQSGFQMLQNELEVD